MAHHKRDADHARLQKAIDYVSPVGSSCRSSCANAAPNPSVASTSGSVTLTTLAAITPHGAWPWALQRPRPSQRAEGTAGQLKA
mmetsp:Transcript_13103/g.10477  ORF Transcript_13103/g.10477 Transcript_13103/m.10477 type:complete len:84 (-) Transcript_13103:18-269(-)